MSDIPNKIKTNISLMLQSFTFPCENFTTIMAIKHELQHSIFNGKCSIDDNIVERVAVILSYLQTLTYFLQDAKVAVNASAI